MKYYKLLDDNNTGSFSRFRWDITGAWMSVDGPLKLCKNGFHVLREEYIGYWTDCGFNLYEVEIGDEFIADDVKLCARSVRVIRKIESYNKESLLKRVIKPAIKRAKKYVRFAKKDDVVLDYVRLAIYGDLRRACINVAYAAQHAVNGYKKEIETQTNDIIKLINR